MSRLRSVPRVDVADEPSETPRWPATEAALAAEFAAAHAGRLRFDFARRAWFTFGPHAWRQDADGGAVRSLQVWLSEQLELAGLLTDRRERETRLALLTRGLRASTLTQLLMLAGHQGPVAMAGHEWDRQPLLVAATNGVIDLEIGVLRHGRPDDLIARTLGAEFDATGACPRWEQFLREVLADEETVNFTWRALGYSLSGLVREHLMFTLAGVTRAGKSTFLKTCRSAWGDYGTTVAFASLTRSRHRSGSEASPDVAVLPGVRLATASEVRDAGRFDEARIKSWTGGDPCSARPLYGRPFEFSPQFKLWLGVNDLPRASDDAAFWTRVRVLPFRTSFLGREDRELEDRLLGELPGILGWSVAGFDAYRSIGLPPSSDMDGEAGRWREANDDLAPFLATLKPEPDPQLVADLFGRYEQWADGERLARTDRLSRIGFGRALAKRFASHRSNGRTYVQLPHTEN